MALLDLHPRKLVATNSKLHGLCCTDIQVTKWDDGKRCKSTLGQEHVSKSATIRSPLGGYDEVVERLVEVREYLPVDT